jgi:AcrR family transcriptional regulator
MTKLPHHDKGDTNGRDDRSESAKTRNISTRQKLIEIIIDIYFRRGGALQVGKVANEAGITRQAFHRYYGDLLGYIKGEKDVNGLLPKSAPNSVSGLLQITQERANQLEKTLAEAQKRHTAELSAALDRHITSLMSNDITLFETDSVRVTLEKQTTLIDHLTKQLNQTKAELTKAKVNVANQRLAGTPGLRIVYEPNLDPASTAYKKTADYTAYLDEKSREIIKLIDKVNQHENSSTQLIIFMERFICDFDDFIAQLPVPCTTEIVIRLPVFSSMEIKNHVRNIKNASISIHVPECSSIAEAVAQRAFRAKKVPIEELSAAEKADHVHLFKGIARIIHFNATSGADR